MKQLQVTILLLFCLTTAIFSQAVWTKSISGITNNLAKVTYGNNTFVAVGALGTIVTSLDGITWTPRTSGTTHLLREITYGNNIFVAVGDSGIILTSVDGISWTQQPSGTTLPLQDIAYGNNTFVAVGLTGFVLTSTNGSLWSLHPISATIRFNHIAYGNNIFVGLEVEDSLHVGGVIQSSPDGISWTDHSSYSYYPNTSIRDIAFGNNMFVIAGYYSNSSYIFSYPLNFTSSDGTTWTSAYPPGGLGWEQSPFSITHVNNHFFIVLSTVTIIYSDDQTWNVKLSLNSVGNHSSGFSFGNNIYVSVGDSGSILTSPVVSGISYTAPKLNYSVFGKTMQIYTLQGKLVGQKKIDLENCLDGKSSLYKKLSKGMYIIRIPIENTVIARRVMVE